MFGLKKKEKAVDEYEVKAQEIMDKVGVPEKMRKGMINHNKAFKMIAEDMFDGEEPLAYLYAINLDKDKMGSILLLTDRRLIIQTSVPLSSTVESISLNQIISVEASKYELVVKAGIRAYGFRDNTGEKKLKDFARSIQNKLYS